jgi:hypothetical protein
VRQRTSTTPIDTSREEEEKGGASEAMTSADERERREGTGNQVDSKTGD